MTYVTKDHNYTNEDKCSNPRKQEYLYNRKYLSVSDRGGF